MESRSSRGLTAEQVRELWRRWKRGESQSDIARSLGKRPASVFNILHRSGGIYRSPRRRCERQLVLAEREAISRGLAAGQSMRAMAVALGRNVSTVSREIARNGGRGSYRAVAAEAAAWRRAVRPKRCKLSRCARLRRIVAGKLSLQWSPEQVSNWLLRTYPDDESLRVSHETIYRTLYLQARGALKKELMAHLRSHRLMRRSRQASNKGQPRGHIIDSVSISERPPEVEDRAIPGHWEGDLLSGSKNTHIATMVERQSRFVMLVKLKGKDAHTIARSLATHIKRLPAQLRRSLTWDRGSEMAQHKQLTLAADIDVYFCDPRSPWQRGSNENTNRLLRQYFPKGTDLSVHSQAHLNKIALRLNQRPRKTLDWDTPANTFNNSVATTR